MTDYWFKPKTYGYGATPANWKGWLATLGYLVSILAATLLILPLQANTGTALPNWIIGLWLMVVAILTIVFVGLSRAKTGGQWRWRWGN